MPPDASLPDVQAVADVIREHLAAHPQAADTAAGIQRWWVLPRLGEVALLTVEDALNLLEAQGALAKLQQPWAETTWALPGRAP